MFPARPLTPLLNLLRALALAAAAALAPPAMAALSPEVAWPQPGSAWWAPFNDPALDTLVARAAGSDTAQRALVQGYVAVRTLQARTALAQRLYQAAARQREMVEAADPPAPDEAAERTRLLETLAARAQHGYGTHQTLAAELERVELTLAALSHTEPQRLHDSLAEGAGTLPQVAWAVPFSLRTGTQAGAAALPALQAAAAQVQTGGQLVEASELELRARQLRERAAGESPLAVLEAYQRLLADGDRLAAAQGALALAWAELLQGLPAEELPRLAAQQLKGTDRALPAP